MRPSLPGPPPLPTCKNPATEKRQPACTHTTVTRLYDDYGTRRCQVCRRYPNIGWIYRCTQDHQGFLPESDFTTTITDAVPVIVSDDRSVWRLKQWMYEAVLKGQYSMEQFSTIFQQRQGVRKAIFSQLDGTITPLTSPSSDCSTQHCDLASITLTSTASSYPGGGCQLNLDKNENFYQVKSCQSIPDNQIPDQCDIATIAGRKTAPNSPYRVCSWTCCQTCRPTYRDRAWQSLDAIVKEATMAPPSWEFENRRISHARIVANIGLPKVYFASQDSHYDSGSEAPLPIDSSHAGSEKDRSANGTFDGRRTKASFRQTVRRTVKEATRHAEASSSEIETSSKNSSQGSLRRMGPSMLFSPRRSSQLGVAYKPCVIDDSQRQESLMLMIAIRTPLPNSVAGVAGLSDGEVEVEDGVAVTEEGIGMGAADIIMQV